MVRLFFLPFWAEFRIFEKQMVSNLKLQVGNRRNQESGNRALKETSQP